MSDEKHAYNIRAIRDLLVSGFNVEQLRGLFSFAKNHDLRAVADEFTPEDSKPAMARKAVEYCQSQVLLDELLAEIKDANPRAYKRFKKKLRVSAASADEEASSVCTEDKPEGSAAWRLYRSAGDEARSSKNWNLAIEDYTLALQENPEDAESYAKRGEAYVNMGEYDEALRDLNRAIALSPSHGAYHDRARAYYAQQRYDQALSDNNEALKRYPKASSTLWNRGLVKEAQGAKYKAIWDFVECATVDSRYRKRVNDKLGELSTPPLPVPPYVSILSSSILRAFLGERVKDVPWQIHFSHLAGHFVALGPQADSSRSRRTFRFPEQDSKWMIPEPTEKGVLGWGLWGSDSFSRNWLPLPPQRSEVESLAAKYAPLDDGLRRPFYESIEKRLQAALFPDNDFISELDIGENWL